MTVGDASMTAVKSRVVPPTGALRTWSMGSPSGLTADPSISTAASSLPSSPICAGASAASFGPSASSSANSNMIPVALEGPAFDFAAEPSLAPFFVPRALR